MKKNILFLLAVLFLACSPRKNSFANRKYQNFTTFYNVLFNGEEAFSSEIEQRQKAHRDNFYAPYIRLITYEEQASEESMADMGLSSDGPPPDFFRETGSTAPQPVSSRGVNTAQIAEIKATKAIEKHSMMFDGVEKNKSIFDAYLLLAKARILQNKNLEALEALNKAQKVFPKDKRLPLIKIYEAYTFGKLKDYYRADEAFRELKEQKIKKSYRKLLSIFYSETLLQANKREEAIEELEEAYALNKSPKLRSRIAFLRGQILASLGKNEEARASFITAYKKAKDFELEVKSQIEIAKTFRGKDADYQEAIEYLENISKKGTYASRKNEFFYAMGIVALNSGDKEGAMNYFRKATKEKISDPQLRGETYFEMGKKFFAENDYLGAGVYFDSAYAVMNHPPTKEKLKSLSKNIKQISTNYYLVKKNDSILKLVNMPEPERRQFFLNYIEKIKEKEEKELQLNKKKEKEKDNFTPASFSFTGNNPSTGSFMDFGTGKGFYFANASTIAKGQNAFRQVWGDRVLADNWRNSARVNTLQDLKKEALGTASAPDPRRLEPEFYLEKLPSGKEEMMSLKKARDTASLGLGRMYEDFFSNTALATKTLYDLVDARPDSETELQALYLIFSMNYEKSPAAAERAKQLILERHPYTSYAEFVKNPQKKNLTQSSQEVEKAYEDAFLLYSEEKFEASKKAIEIALQKYSQDRLVPKFLLLQAFNTGKTAGKEVMILQLEQLMLNFGKTPEGLKASEMLKTIKSDLKPELFDNTGAASSMNALPSTDAVLNKDDASASQGEKNNKKAGKKTTP